MDARLLLQGMMIGLSIAAPVGPINLLCIRRIIADGRMVGFASGLGAAVADATYGAVAAFGLTAVSGLLVSGQSWLRVVGGLFLLYLGAQTFLAKPSGPAEARDARHLLGAFASTYVLTLTNPLTILSFAAIFTGLGVVRGDGGYASASLLVLGVALGSMLWWAFLCITVGAVRERVTPGALRWVNRVSGCVIAGFGVVALCIN